MECFGHCRRDVGSQRDGGHAHGVERRVHSAGEFLGFSGERGTDVERELDGRVAGGNRGYSVSGVFSVGLVNSSFSLVAQVPGSTSEAQYDTFMASANQPMRVVQEIER